MSGGAGAVRVLKFGGTSVADAARLRLAAGAVRRAAREGAVWVVVSALAGVTDLLERAVRCGAAPRRTTAELARRHRAVLAALGARGRWRDTVRRRLELLPCRLAAAAAGDPWAREWALAAGERLAAAAMAAALEAAGLAVTVVDAARLVAVRGAPGGAEVDLRATARRAARVRAALPAGVVAVVPGFFGGDARGRPLTLGRGASDLSAAVLGAALGTAAVEIWTDVPGVLSAPPRWVPEAAPVARLGWREAAWLAELGARVLQPEAARWLARWSVPAAVASALAPGRGGTRIGGTGASGPVVTGRGGWMAAPRGAQGALAIRPLAPVAGPEAVREGWGPEPVAVVGVAGVPREAVVAAARRLRPPVLGEVHALGGPGVALAVREVWLPRTVAALHRALARRCSWRPAAAAGGGR